MSYYALDKNNTPISATEVTAANQHDNFFCPNQNCKCIFHFRAYESNAKAAHFFKLPSSTHIEDCWVDYEYSENGYLYSYNFKKFTLTDFFQDIQSSKINSNSSSDRQTGTDISKRNNPSGTTVLPIRTIRQLHALCIHNADTQKIGNIQIKNIFVGRKTAYLYTKYCSGLKLVEIRYNSYKSESNMLFFTYPYSKNKETPSIKFNIQIPDKKLFHKKQTELYELYHCKKTPTPVLIFAEFKMYGDRSCATITCSKQIIPLKTADQTTV